MRAYLASAVGVACTAALALPLTGGPGAIAAPRVVPHAAPPRAALPGSTQSLPLSPLARPAASQGRANAEPEYGVQARDVRPFSLVGVVWDDARAELSGRVQVRTRATGTGRWSGWQDVETHGGDAPDLGGADRSAGTVRGATAPLWVGDSDGVRVRVQPQAPASHPGDDASATTGDPADPAGDTTRSARRPAADHRHAHPGAEGAAPAGRLPAGLRLELVDPGDPPTTDTAKSAGPTEPATGVGRADHPDRSDQTDQPDQTDQTDQADQADREAGEPPAERAPGDAEGSGAEAAVDGQTWVETGTDHLVLDQTRAVAADLVLPQESAAEVDARRTWKRRYLAPRPRIVLRKGWSADERLRERRLGYTKTVKAAFVHHSATGNNYRCAQAPAVIRGIYRYHVKSSGWRDLGYNFLVDKCGNIYEGRAGGPGKPVLGAHTLGFNSNSTGIAVLGTYSRSTPPRAAVRAVARLTAWKLGLHGRDPSASTYLVSGGSNKYRKGVTVRLNVISGHRDGFTTDCPGTQLYRRLGAARSVAAQLQGR
ncbi:N-acetylmuramoyl-L-alanine amidase [Streptomyces sp. NPDC057702]|uniref:N-acetylmuramoyl-L-alanine amidase n=1 Tax=unclassified Streptomyces TaxID=2593676 RepID=UPI0036C7B7AE